MTKTRIVPSWQNAIIILSGTVVSLIIVIALQWGRPVLVPIALAILLTFLLNPVVKKLQQCGLGRMPAVLFGVSAAGLAMLLIGGLVARQFTILVAELPQNTAIIKAKVRTLRQFGSSPMAAQFEKMAEEISEATTLSPAMPIPENGESHDPDLLEKVVASGPLAGADGIDEVAAADGLSQLCIRGSGDTRVFVDSAGCISHRPR